MRIILNIYLEIEKTFAREFVEKEYNSNSWTLLFNTFHTILVKKQLTFYSH